MWLEKEIETARDIYAQQKTLGLSDRPICKLIAPEVGKTWCCVRSRLQLYGPTFTGKPKPQKPNRKSGKLKSEHLIGFFVDPRERPDDQVIAERDRMMMLVPASTTALLMGDPLPGRSALDQKLASE